MRPLAVATLVVAACQGHIADPGVDAAPPAPLCGPTGGGPFWVLEGETVTFTVVCATGEVHPIAMTAGPAGASFDGTTFTWTPGLDQGAVHEIAFESAGESALVTVGVADRWNDPANVPVVDPARYTLEYGLPVFHIQPAGPVDDLAYTPATITYRGHVYTAEIKKRGAASIWYPKNSYTLKFAREDKLDEPVFPTWDGGFHEKRKISLTTTFDDNSHIRTRLAFELWNRLDPGHIQVQSYSAVVFLGGEYHGLYQATDKVDGFLMEDFGYWQDGNLYKAVNHDANFRLDGKATPHDGLVKKEGFPLEGEPGAFADLDELVTWIATASDDDFHAGVDARIDRRDYEDWWIFVSLIMADDSAGKNSYHYHDPNGGLWRYIPWDFNDSFGQTWQSARKGWDTHPDDYTWANELFTRFLADPRLADPLRARYAEALGGAYAVDEVLALVDAMVAETAPSARRDEEKWAEAYRTYGGWSWRDDFTTYDGEIAYLRAWIEGRWAFVGGLW